MIFRWKEYLAVAIATLSLAGCSPVEKAPLSSGSSDQTSTTPTTTGSPLYFYIMSKPEGSAAGNYTAAGSCIIPYGTATGTSDADQVCSISMHELTMYFGDMKFVVGTSDASTCALISFEPYYFAKSTAAGFTDSGAIAATDCSVLSPPAACYGGAAPLIMTTDFPTSSGYFFVPGDSLETNWTIDSQNKQRIAHATDLSFVYSNVNLANNLVNRTPAISYSSAAPWTPVNFAGGVANYHDYVVTCKNTYGERLYSITLTLSDVDSTVDNYYDWN